MLYGVRLGDYHSYNDLGLILTSREISAPEVKTSYVEIEGADGSLDFTEAFGKVTYNNRDISLNFSCICSIADFPQKFSELQNLLHGRKLKISFDNDLGFYYWGRCTINKWTVDKVLGTFTIDVECDPYKYREYETINEFTVSGSKTIALSNMRMSAIPYFKSDALMTINYNDATFTIDPSNDEKGFADIILEEGITLLDVTGTGKLTVRYQEGSL